MSQNQEASDSSSPASPIDILEQVPPASHSNPEPSTSSQRILDIPEPAPRLRREPRRRPLPASWSAEDLIAEPNQPQPTPPRDRLTPRIPPGSLPYDPLNAENSIRLRVEDIIAAQQTEEGQHTPLTDEEIKLLKPVIKPFILKTGQKRSTALMKGWKSRLNKLNEARLDILGRNGFPRKVIVPNILGREVLAMPELARDTRTMERRTTRSSIPVPRSSIPIPLVSSKNATRTFLPVTSQPRRSVPVRVPVMHPFTAKKTSLPSKPTQAITTVRSPVELVNKGFQSRLSSEESHEESKSQYEIQVGTICPPFKDKSVRCASNEASDYFSNLQKITSGFDGAWVLTYGGLAAGPIFDNFYATIPPDKRTEMNEMRDAMKIKTHNAFLGDGCTNKWLESCNRVCYKFAFIPRTKTPRLIDLRTIMNAILQDFIPSLNEGIKLPSISLKNLKSRNKSRRRQHKGVHLGPIILENMIPPNERDLYVEFINKRMNDAWRAFSSIIVNFGDGLGFLPNYSMSSKLYDVICLKLHHQSTNIHQGDKTVILWSEIQQILNYASGQDRCNSKEFKAIQARLNGVAGVTLFCAFIPICVEGAVPYGFLQCVPDCQDIRIYLPEQPRGAFGKWAETSKDRMTLGNALVEIKTVVEELWGQTGEWCQNQSVADYETSKDWPWNCDFIQDGNVQTSDNLPLSPVYSLMWYERAVGGENVELRRIIDHNILQNGDARVYFYELINDQFL